MTQQYPDNWEIPTLSFLKDEPLVGGIPNKQAAIIGLCGFMTLMFTKEPLSLFLAVPLALIVSGTLFAIARWKYSRNPRWYELMTSHVYPADRWLGN